MVSFTKITVLRLLKLVCSFTRKRGTVYVPINKSCQSLNTNLCMFFHHQKSHACMHRYSIHECSHTGHWHHRREKKLCIRSHLCQKSETANWNKLNIITKRSHYSWQTQLSEAEACKVDSFTQITVLYLLKLVCSFTRMRGTVYVPINKGHQSLKTNLCMFFHHQKSHACMHSYRIHECSYTGHWHHRREKKLCIRQHLCQKSETANWNKLNIKLSVVTTTGKHN